jgi:hypothetical protein
MKKTHILASHAETGFAIFLKEQLSFQYKNKYISDSRQKEDI